MASPISRGNSAQAFHVNYHTVRNRPVFEVPEYRQYVEGAMVDVLQRWQIPTLAWQVMPTHIHVIVLVFPDLSLGRAVNLIKGYTARKVMVHAPELRGELDDHLWQEGYDWVEIQSHRQCVNAIRYVQENRLRAGLDD